MKKYLIGLFLGILVMGVTACGAKEKPDNSQNTGTQNPQSTETESSGVGVSESEGEPQGGASDAELLETDGGWSAEMQQVRDAIAAEFGENYFPNMQVPQESLEMQIGISSDMYEDYLFEVPMISVNVDTLLIIKVKEGKVEDVESAVKAYQRNQQENSMQYPMNLGKVQASGVETIGNYVCFVQLGAATDEIYETGDDEAVIKHCQEQNEQALNIIRQKLSTQ